MHEKTINQRFNENEAQIRNLAAVKLDAFLFESEVDHRDTIVNDIRVIPDPAHAQYLIEYTVTKPLIGAHEKKRIAVNSPDYSIRVYQDTAGVHIEAVPAVDGVTIGYNPQGELYSIAARPDTDDQTIEYNAANQLSVKDGSIGEDQLSAAWKNARQDTDDAVQSAIQNLADDKADKIITIDPATGTVTTENLIDVKQALADETARVETDLLAEIADLDAAKEDKSPIDGKLYGLKDGGKVELLPGYFGVTNAVDGVAPNAAGNVYLDAAHLIHDPTTQKVYSDVPIGGFLGVIAFDTASTPAPSTAVEEMIFEDDDGAQFALRVRADGFLIATHPDNTTETVLWRPDYGWQTATYPVNGTLVSHTPMTADVWNAVFLSNAVDLIDVRESSLQKTDADFNFVTSVVPRKLYDTTVLEERVKNPVTGISQIYMRYIPHADEQNAGLMPKESVTSLRIAKADIEILKGVGRVAANLGLTPAQAELDSAWKTGKNTTTIAEGATVVNLDQDPPLGHSWTYLTDAATGTAEWIDRGTDIVNTASNDHEGVVLGDASTQGKVSVNADGSMSVNGWTQNISNVQLSGITADTADYGTAVAGSIPTLLLSIVKKIRGLFSFFTNGVAKKAIQLNTARNISLSGSASGSASFDGSANISIPVTIPLASTSQAGLMSATDKYRLDTLYNNLSVNAVSISPSGGHYMNPIIINMSTTTPGATIKYTLNGNTPSQTVGNIYSGGMQNGISSPIGQFTVKAVAIKNDITSAVTSVTYTVEDGIDSGV